MVQEPTMLQAAEIKPRYLRSRESHGRTPALVVLAAMGKLTNNRTLRNPPTPVAMLDVLTAILPIMPRKKSSCSSKSNRSYVTDATFPPRQISPNPITTA